MQSVSFCYPISYVMSELKAPELLLMTEEITYGLFIVSVCDEL